MHSLLSDKPCFLKKGPDCDDLFPNFCECYWRFCVLIRTYNQHDDVIGWNHFRVTGLLCGEFISHRPVIRSFDVFFDLCLNIWAHNWDASDLRRHRSHYDVTVMGAMSQGVRLRNKGMYRMSWCLAMFLLIWFIYNWMRLTAACRHSYAQSREYWVVSNRYSRLLFTSEDRHCANWHVHEQSTNMTSQCQ